MESFELIDRAEFAAGTDHGHAKVLFADQLSRTLLFALKDGQSVKEHHANTPVHITVLQGNGVFTAGDGREVNARPASMLILAPGEEISGRAAGGDLIFVAVLQGAPHASSDHEAVRG